MISFHRYGLRFFKLTGRTPLLGLPVDYPIARAGHTPLDGSRRLWPLQRDAVVRFSSEGTRTGRNVQDFARQYPPGPGEARQTIVPRPDHTYVQCDYDGVEMRIMAHVGSQILPAKLFEKS